MPTPEQSKQRPKPVHKRAKRGVSGGFESKDPDEAISYEAQRKQSRAVNRKSRVKPLTKASGSGRGAERKSNKGGRARHKRGG
jgi:hypothetical protein